MKNQHIATKTLVQSFVNGDDELHRRMGLHINIILMKTCMMTKLLNTVSTSLPNQTDLLISETVYFLTVNLLYMHSAMQILLKTSGIPNAKWHCLVMVERWAPIGNAAFLVFNYHNLFGSMKITSLMYYPWPFSPSNTGLLMTVTRVPPLLYTGNLTSPIYISSATAVDYTTSGLI